ncbi:glycosyltransferase family 1 protein [Candidatus Bathyarchaeota archaeon]|nr:MAG: glycosyltransferase family 1 protein [Candidatus Bathyarchaeota archaeon]
MKVCMLTWEYPPRIVGGIARHCEGLAKALAKLGVDVDVVTLDFPGAPEYEEIDGVKVYRVRPEIGHPNFLTWVMLFNHFLEKKIAGTAERENYDLIHIHDWLVAPSGVAVKHFLKKPLIATIHSTENGRSGLHTPDSYTIDSWEWWTTYEASKVIVTSNSMKHEVCGHFHLPWEKVEMVPNGIEIEKFNIPVDRVAVRGRYGVSPNEKLILYVGRLVPQKGVEYLIQAVPMIASRYPNAKFIIVGEGWLRDYLESLAQSTGQRWRITFTGFVPDHEAIALMKSADALVIPSVYEPFGIVALEGMTAGVPVIASQVGGLAEIIEHDKTGVFIYPRNPESLAWGVDHVLSNPGHAEWLVKNAHEKVKEMFSWNVIAERTVEIYKSVLGE